MVKTKLNKYLVAGGNSTLLVRSYKSCEKEKIIKKYLGLVEQIGFVSYPRGIPKLIMMGNEFSGNSTLALASMLPNKSGLLLSSGYKGYIRYQNRGESSSIQFKIKYKKIGNIILLDGIGFVFLKNNKRITKGYLSSYCIKYNLPAFGAIFYKNNELIPFVYVKQTDSLFRETSCGSASIAINILTGEKSITQPTGKIINIARIGNTFTISAEAIEIKMKGGYCE